MEAIKDTIVAVRYKHPQVSRGILAGEDVGVPLHEAQQAVSNGAARYSDPERVGAYEALLRHQEAAAKLDKMIRKCRDTLEAAVSSCTEQVDQDAKELKEARQAASKLEKADKAAAEDLIKEFQKGAKQHKQDLVEAKQALAERQEAIAAFAKKVEELGRIANDKAKPFPDLFT